MNSTDECPSLGDALPVSMYMTADTYTNQWKSLKENYVIELNAWLKTASHIPGIPERVEFFSTDLNELWEEIQLFVNRVSTRRRRSLSFPALSFAS